MKMNKTREQITEYILNVLNEGEIPFNNQWITPDNYNATTEQRYRGINQLLLSFVAAERGLDDPRWATYSQARKNQWQVKQGAKGVPIEFWSFYDIQQKETISISEANRRVADNPDYQKNLKAISKVYTVFNGKDIEGIPLFHKRGKDFQLENVLASKVLTSYLENEKINLIHEGSQSYYRPTDDSIHLPKISNFKSEYDYQSVLAHEICHSTGNKKRMNREISNDFGTKKYALEELRAEIGSCFLCNDLEFEFKELDIQNHKAYIQNWIKIITEAPVELFKAINDAQKISDFVLEKGEFKKVKEKVEEQEIEKSLESFNYRDIEEQILIFESVKQQSTLFTDIEFTDEEGYYYETGIEADKVVEYVDDISNQKTLVKWLIDHDTSCEMILEHGNDLEYEEDLGISLEKER